MRRPWVGTRSSQAVVRRSNKRCGREIAALEHSLASLLLESDAKRVVEIFQGTLKAFGEYSAVFARGIQAAREAGEKPGTALFNALTELESRVPELEEMARRHLSSLEQPI